MKFVVTVFAILCLAVATAFAIGYWIERPTTLDAPAQITIAAGDNTSDIARKLDSAGVIHSQRAFRWMARWRKIDRHLRPGRYNFEGVVHLSDVLDALQHGRAMQVAVTIPEGWSTSRIAEHSSAQLGFVPDSFLAITRDPELLRQWTDRAHSIEGYLLPETYHFYWGVDPREVVQTMLQHSKSLFSDALLTRAKTIGLTRHQVLTLASMIEAEAADGNERGLISGVFHNRLRDGWLLQCDPTVIFAMGGLPPGRALQRSDLEFDSPYNTYLYPGLPPGPICNPGTASILAALYPESTDAMYFVANGDGTHSFSRTLDQHNNARARIKREMRER